MRHIRQPAINLNRRHVYIAMGSNEKSSYGDPFETLTAAIAQIEELGLPVKAASVVYGTTPVGGGRQPCYCNAVIAADLTMGVASVLRLLKRLERAAGRRLGRHWGPRPLDLDIIDAGVITGRPGRARRVAGQLILPHPEMHRRAFVLVPLAEIAPHWRHPVLDRGVRCLLEDPRVRVQRRGVRPQRQLEIPR